MARSIRIEFEGAFYHVIARENETAFAPRLRKMTCSDENLTLIPFP